MWAIQKSLLESSLFFRKFSWTSALACLSWLMLNWFSCCPSVSKGQIFHWRSAFEVFQLKFLGNDARLLSNLLDCKTKISTNHVTNSLEMTVVCWCGKLSRPGVFTDWCSTLFEILKPLVALHTTHAFLPVSLLQQLPNVSQVRSRISHTRLVPQVVA